MTHPDLRLHRFALSGHCHRVELLLSLLGLPATRIDVDLAGGEHKRPAFLAKNPLGQVPVLEDGPLTLPDSNAILVYLATRYDAERRWLPVDPAAQARVQRWLSIAAGQLASGPAAARMVRVFGAPYDHARALAIGQVLLGFVEQHLAGTPFLAGETATLADVAMYAYVARAPEGGLSLQPYPRVRGWLTRVEDLPAFVAMPEAPAHAAA